MTAPNLNDQTPPEPEEGADVLDDVRRFLERYVAFPTEHAAVAVTLWTAHAHLFERFDSTPRLALLSPEPGSGKSRTLEVLELLTPAPMAALSASPAAIFRTIDNAPPTLLLDEVDAIFGRYGKSDDNEDLRALLNAGHRNGAQIPRCVGPTHDVKLFQVFCPVALAGLGDLPDTLMTRSVVIRMRRRRPDEQVTPFRHREATAQGDELRGRLATWCATIADHVGLARPELPVEDRPADMWEPLIAVADAAGGHWPRSARSACSALAGAGQSREASLGIRLLADLRDIFGDAAQLSTTVILEGLNGLDEAPWADLHGKALDARGLARRLHQYGIESAKVRIGDSSVRGYRREDLWDAWQRYCPLPTPGEGEHPEHPEHTRSGTPFSVPDNGDVPEHDSQAEQKTPPTTWDVPLVPDVPEDGTQEGDPLDPFAPLDTDRYEADYPEMFQ